MSRRKNSRLIIECSVFDNGGLKDDPVKVRKVIDILLSEMGISGLFLTGTSGATDCDQFSTRLKALFDVYTSVWRRIVQGSSIGVQNRFACSMRSYFEGTLKQVHYRARNQHPTFQETLDMRRGSSGVSPLFALAE